MLIDFSGQLSTRIPPGVPRQAQRAIHQLRLNRLTSTASYQAFVDLITSPICPRCGNRGNGEQTAEHFRIFHPKWAAERQRYFLRATAGTAIARLSHRNSVRPSVRLSVCHTGGSGKNGAS